MNIAEQLDRFGVYNGLRVLTPEIATPAQQQ